MKFKFLIFLWLSIPVQGQTTFLHQFDTRDLGEGSDLLLVSGNSPEMGYALVSKVYDFENPNDSLKVVHRFDKCDNLIWSKLISFSSSCPRPFSTFGPLKDYFATITPDGGVVVSTIGRMCDLTYKLLLVKLDINGNLVYNKLIEFDEKTENLKLSAGIRCLSNGDFYLFGTSNYGTFVYRLDSNLNVKWGKIYDYDLYYHILTQDEGLLLYYENKLLRIDDSGNVLWSKVLSKEFEINYAVEMFDGFVLLDASGSQIITPNDQDYLNLMKLNPDGSIKWQNDPFVDNKNIFHPFIRISYMVAQGNQLFVVAAWENGKGRDKFIIYKLDGNGKVIQGKILSSEIDDHKWYVHGMINHPVSGLLIHGGHFAKSSTNITQPILFTCRMYDDLFVNNCYFEPTSSNPDTVIEKATISDGIKDFSAVTLRSITDLTVQVSDVIVDELPGCDTDNQIGLGSDTTLCHGSLMILKSQNKFNSYKWSTGETTRSILVNKQGTYSVTGKNACETVTDTITISYYPDPKISFRVEPQAASVYENIYFKSLTPTPGNVTWKIGAGYPIDEKEFTFQYPLNGLYNIKYIFTDANGCSFSDSTDLKIYTLNISIPNTFTPNGDNLNETFAPVGFGVKSFKLTVFNRWGGIAYEGYEPWDGGGAPAGLYVYQMEITDDFDEVRKETGRVLLTR